MIHIDKGGNKEATKWFLDHLAQYHVPFDVLGQSYYPWWHGSLDDLKDNLAFTWNTYHKDVVVVETAYDWRTGEDFKGSVAPFPETPEGQREFLAALDRVVREAPGGKMRGIFWWEPMAGGAIAKRGLFDDQHEALPAIQVFGFSCAITRKLLKMKRIRFGSPRERRRIPELKWDGGWAKTG